MRADTRLFGELEIAEEKIIKFEQGIIGFPDLKNFALIFDEEKGEETKIKWLQSMDEPEFAMPVMDPYCMVSDYSPTLNDDAWKNVEKIRTGDRFVLVTVTVPADIEQISINLKAPIIIDTDTNKAYQVIVENDYPVKYKIYDRIKRNKEKAGE